MHQWTVGCMLRGATSALPALHGGTPIGLPTAPVCLYCLALRARRAFHALHDGRSSSAGGGNATLCNATLAAGVRCCLSRPQLKECPAAAIM